MVKDDNGANIEMNRRAALTRRNLVMSGALGSAAMMAGCLGSDDEGTPTEGNGDGTPTEGNGGDDTPTEGTATPQPDYHVEGQELIMPTNHNPEETYFIPDSRGGLFKNEAYDFDLEYESPSSLLAFFNDTLVWSRVMAGVYEPNPGPFYPGLLEDFTIEPKVMTATIREDTGWSDGEDFTAIDLAVGFVGQQASVYQNDEDPESYAKDPEEGAWFPVQDIKLPEGEDGKVVEYHNWDWDEYPAWEEVNGFEAHSMSTLMGHLLGPGRRRGMCWPMHKEPWASAMRDLWEWRQEHKLAGPDPQPVPFTFQEHLAEYVSKDDVLASREEGGFPTLGAWQLEEPRGSQEIVLKPNEHHYAYDEINFDKVRLKWEEEDNRTQAALVSGEHDYASVTTPPETESSYPDKYNAVTSPSGWGELISFDHGTLFGDVRVRKAIMYALDKEAIAGNVHPTAAEPVKVPGLDMWASDAVITEDWARENLIDYSQDTDKAAQLMRDAGWEMQDGVWHKDGEPFQFQLPTNSDNPVFEQTIAEQLRDFGMDLNVQSYDTAVYVERVEGSDVNEIIEDEYGGAGDFQIWSGVHGNQLAGFYDGAEYFWYGTVNNRSRVRAHNFYDHDKQEEGILLTDEDNYDGYGPSGWSWACVPQCQVEWTIDIPSEIGNPDSDLEPFNPSAMTNWGIFAGRGPEHPFDDNPYYNPPHDESHPENADYYWKKFMWTANWFLPALPIVRNTNQHYLNDANWQWPNEIGGEANEYLWDYFGLAYGTDNLLGSGNKLLADPDNPKSGADVVEE